MSTSKRGARQFARICIVTCLCTFAGIETSESQTESRPSHTPPTPQSRVGPPIDVCRGNLHYPCLWQPRQTEKVAVSPHAAEADLRLTPYGKVAVQDALRLRGYRIQTIDGEIGPGTRQAILAFQRDNNWQPTGYVTKLQFKNLIDWYIEFRDHATAARFERADRVLEQVHVSPKWPKVPPLEDTHPEIQEFRRKMKEDSQRFQNEHDEVGRSMKERFNNFRQRPGISW